MPAKKVVTREKILEVAFEIVRSMGIDALNMRLIADRCKCSTQPIYLSFSGMDELKTEVAKEVLNTFNRYIADEIASGRYPEYKAVGMGYIRFAKEEKELFKYLMMNGGLYKTGLENETFNGAVGIINKNYGMGASSAEQLHLELWIFVHGIATMFSTQFIEWDEDTVSGMVTDAFKGFSHVINGGNNGR